MDTVSSAHAAALWTGLHLILLLVLSVMVVRLRQKHKIALGDEGIPELARAIRAFGNATEYVPAGLIALAVLAMNEDSALTVHIEQRRHISAARHRHRTDMGRLCVRGGGPAVLRDRLSRVVPAKPPLHKAAWTRPCCMTSSAPR